MPEILERITQLAETALARLKVSSALNSCLWLCGIAIPAGLIFAARMEGIPQIAGLAVAFIPITLFVVGFIFFMLTNPDKLRSEEYEIKKMDLELIEEKGGRIPISGTSIEAIANPNYRTLPGSRDPEAR